jgi:hypothetical protein
MARYELTLQEQLRDVKSALAGRTTPAQLKNSLRRRILELGRQIRDKSRTRNKFASERSASPLAKTRLFITFDLDHGEDLRNLLAGQAKPPDTPSEIYDRSLKEPLEGGWKERFRRRLANMDQMVLICGDQTQSARGVADEVTIARERKNRTFY